MAFGILFRDQISDNISDTARLETLGNLRLMQPPPRVRKCSSLARGVGLSRLSPPWRPTPSVTPIKRSCAILIGNRFASTAYPLPRSPRGFGFTASKSMVDRPPGSVFVASVAVVTNGWRDAGRDRRATPKAVPVSQPPICPRHRNEGVRRKRSSMRHVGRPALLRECRIGL
jgi:hypothetical protein